jgi:hypothetical protein
VVRAALLEHYATFLDAPGCLGRGWETRTPVAPLTTLGGGSTPELIPSKALTRAKDTRLERLLQVRIFNEVL